MRRRARIDRGTSSANARRACHAPAAPPAPAAPGRDDRGAPRDDQDSRFVEGTCKQENSIPQSIPCAIPLPGEPSAAVTRLERWINPRCEENGGRSGFRLLPTGLDAFVARAVLIELADRTLDLQYYIFHPDETGSLIIDRLIAAADRGVRVRILLDDWGTLEKKDEVVAGLDAHANIAIRVFNPYIHRSGLHRLGELLTSFTRVNRRMHNKQFIADGAAVVLGGRNIGDEYFSRGELDFQDVDVLVGGPVAQQSAHSFEAYWTSKYAIPITRLGNFTPDPALFATRRQLLSNRCELLQETEYARALAGSALATELRTHALHLDWAEAKV